MGLRWEEAPRPPLDYAALKPRGWQAEEHLRYREWSDCASVSTGCPKAGMGGPRGSLQAWGLGGQRDGAGQGDLRGRWWWKTSGCHSAWLITLKEERQGSAGAHLSALGCARKEGERRAGGGTAVSRSYRSHSGALTREGGEWPDGAGGTFLFHLLSKSKPRKHLCQQGTNKLHIKQRKGHLPGGSWAGKTRLCVYSWIFSLTSSYENKKLLKTDLLLN